MSTTLESYSKLIERDLNQIIKEINLYTSESDLWKLEGDISNSGGNLILHIIGNLRHFIGHVLGASDYQRNRNSEFNDKNVSQIEMIQMLKLTIEEVNKAFYKLTEDQLDKKYPIEVLGYEMTTGYFIMHLIGHLNYHLGQVNYHRRLLKS